MKLFLAIVQTVFVIALILSFLIAGVAFVVDQIDAYRWRKARRSA